MKFPRLMIAAVMAGGLLALAGCGLDEPSAYDTDAAFAQMTVIDAVQLGAAQSCHSVSGTVSGSLTIRPLLGSDDLVLLVEDEDPVCIDTMENIADELQSIEADYSEDIEPVGSEVPAGLVNMVLTKTDKPGDAETDPNPQPAIDTGVALITVKTTVKPGTPVNPDKPAPNPDNPPENPSTPD